MEYNFSCSLKPIGFDFFAGLSAPGPLLRISVGNIRVRLHDAHLHSSAKTKIILLFRSKIFLAPFSLE